MYERFTDRARKMMELAREEAVRLNHEYVGSEHILLGMVQAGDGVAGAVLCTIFDVDLPKARAEIEKITPPLPNVTIAERLPLSACAKQSIVFAVEECRKLDHNYVGTEHLILGLARTDGGAIQALAKMGVQPAAVRNEVLRILGHGDHGDPPVLNSDAAPGAE